MYSHLARILRRNSRPRSSFSICIMANMVAAGYVACLWVLLLASRCPATRLSSLLHSRSRRRALRLSPIVVRRFWSSAAEKNYTYTNQSIVNNHVCTHTRLHINMSKHFTTVYSHTLTLHNILVFLPRTAPYQNKIDNYKNIHAHFFIPSAAPVRYNIDMYVSVLPLQNNGASRDNAGRAPRQSLISINIQGHAAITAPLITRLLRSSIVPSDKPGRALFQPLLGMFLNHTHDPLQFNTYITKIILQYSIHTKHFTL